MPNRTFRVRVLFPEAPERKTVPPTPERYVESPAHGFTLQARTFDAAATESRARAVANGLVVRSVSHSPGDVLVMLARDPKTMRVSL